MFLIGYEKMTQIFNLIILFILGLKYSCQMKTLDVAKAVSMPSKH